MKTAIFTLLIIMAALAYRLYSAPAPVKPPVETEIVEPTAGIHLLSATYGGNCGGPSGNATKAVGASCDGKDSCTYKVEVQKLGDPAQGCGKSFAADYECLPSGTPRSLEIQGEAGMGSEAVFDCAAPAKAETAAPEAAPSSAGGLYITSATYGLNCGAPAGNATRDLGALCNGKDRCDYAVQVTKFGDPKQGCAKGFTAEYTCAPGAVRFTKRLLGESGLGAHLLLDCAAPLAGDASSPVTAVADPPAAGIYVKVATYGLNCGAKAGNATIDLSNSCNGKEDCDYQVDVMKFGDPRANCGKDFTVRYECAPSRAAISKKIPGESGLGSHMLLECPKKAASAP